MNKDCEWCHNPLPKNSGKDRKYCSAKCKQSRAVLLKKARQVHERENQICKHCGKKFAWKALKLYCSLDCQKAVSRANVIARKKKVRRNLKCKECGKRLINAKKMTARFCPICLKDRPNKLRRDARAAKNPNILVYPLGNFVFDPEVAEKFVPQTERFDFPSTDHQPGTDGKIAVLQERITKGLPLFHPDDPTFILYDHEAFNIPADF